MNETLLWLLYFIGAVVAFLCVYRFGTRIVPAILAGTFLTMFGWLLLFLLTPEELQPSFWRVHLSLNACFGLIFAAGGAALGFYLAMRREAAVRRTEGSD